MTEQHPAPRPVDLEAAYRAFDETWSPRIVATVNDYDVKVALVEGEYVPHTHAETDEFFLVLAGELTIELDGRDPVRLGPMQVFTVPRGQRHRPVAAPGTRILMLEPHGTLNSGDARLGRDSRLSSTTGLMLTDDPKP